MKKVAPAPPYSSGISMPMMPSSKQASMGSRGIFASSSIFGTRGRIVLGELAHDLAEGLLVLGEVGQGQAAECLSHG